MIENPQPPEIPPSREVVDWKEETYFEHINDKSEGGDDGVNLVLTRPIEEIIAGSDENTVGSLTYNQVVAKIKDGDRLLEMRSGRINSHRYLIGGAPISLHAAILIGKDTVQLKNWQKQGIKNIFIGRDSNYYADDGKTTNVPQDDDFDLVEI